MVSFYGLLGVTSEATGEEIKLAFKRRALQVHPDKGTMEGGRRGSLAGPGVVRY